MKCLGFREPTMALEFYERPVIRNTIQCPPGRITGVAVGMLTWMAASTNGLLPFLPEQEYFLAWLGINDLVLCGLLTAAVITIKTETAVPAIKERLSKPGPVIADTRIESLEDWTGQCDRCAIIAPVRAHHCRYCEKCVDVFDHHCEILGACVGKANHRAFLVTMVSTLLYLISTLAMCIAAVCMVAGFDIDIAMNKVAWIFFNVFTAAMTIFPIGILMRLTYWQIRAGMLGISQYEWFCILSAERFQAQLDVEAKKEAEKQAKADKVNKEAEAEANAILAYYAALDVPEIVVVQ